MKQQPIGFQEAAASFEHSIASAQSGLREVQASVAKTHFSQLLDEVERGGSFVIMRHGRPIARLVPDEEHRRRQVQEALANIEALRQKIRAEHGAMTTEEILALRHEGHKY